MKNPFETHGAASWIELHTTDAAKATDFYRDVLGWEIEKMKMPDGSAYTLLKAAGDRVGGIVAGQNGASRWLAYITVDDVDTRVASAEKAGAKILSQPTAVPGVGRMATIEDPTGAAICLITYGG